MVLRLPRNECGEKTKRVQELILEKQGDRREANQEKEEKENALFRRTSDTSLHGKREGSLVLSVKVVSQVK